MGKDNIKDNRYLKYRTLLTTKNRIIHKETI